MDNMKPHASTCNSLKENITDKNLIFIHFFPAGVSASSPTKSQLVDAIYILHCEEFPVARKSRAPRQEMHTSQWRLVVTVFNAIWIRIISEAVL